MDSREIGTLPEKKYNFKEIGKLLINERRI